MGMAETVGYLRAAQAEALELSARIAEVANGVQGLQAGVLAAAATGTGARIGEVVDIIAGSKADLQHASGHLDEARSKIEDILIELENQM